MTAQRIMNRYTELMLIGARRMLHDPDAWRKRGEVATHIRNLEGLLAPDNTEAKADVVQSEAASLIKRLRIASIKPEGAF